MYGNNEDEFEDYDVVDLFPNSIDLGVDEKLLNMKNSLKSAFGPPNLQIPTRLFSSFKCLPGNGGWLLHSFCIIHTFDKKLLLVVDV